MADGTRHNARISSAATQPKVISERPVVRIRNNAQLDTLIAAVLQQRVFLHSCSPDAPDECIFTPMPCCEINPALQNTVTLKLSCLH